MDFKHLSLDVAEVKFTDGRQFTGYASMFNGVDAYGDTIAPGAYEKTISDRERPIRMRWNHFGPVIGKWVGMVEDQKGLKVTGELTPGHSVADNVYASMKHGAVDGMSIGYRIPEGGSEQQGGKRLIKQIDLVEISVVEEPADLGAKVGDVKYIHEMISDMDSAKEAEAILREVGGFSRSGAKHLVSAILGLRDEGESKSHGWLEAVQSINVTKEK